MTTMKDISETTGVSIKTVSRALNGHSDMSSETKKRIVEAARRLAYRPNLLARSLRKKKSYAIGLVVPDITNEFFGEVAIAIEEFFKRHSYSVLLSFSNGERDEEIKSIESLITRQIEGIILATIGTTKNFVKRVINELRTPIVLIDNKIPDLRTNVVLHDNAKGAYLLTKHLVEHGHRKIACIAGPLDETSGKKRLEGYKKALRDSNLEPRNEFIKISNWKRDGGSRSAMELLSNNREAKPTAFFVANSVMALGVLNAIHNIGLQVPNDIALVAFDNMSFAEDTNPPLTTLEKCEREIGEIASRKLYENMTKRDRKMEEILVAAKLHIRKSCGC